MGIRGRGLRWWLLVVLLNALLLHLKQKDLPLCLQTAQDVDASAPHWEDEKLLTTHRSRGRDVVDVPVKARTPGSSRLTL